MDVEQAPAAAVRAFDRLAPVYDRLAEGDLFRGQRTRTHAALTRWLPPRSRVLEIGCGTGIDTAFLAAAGMDVVACDPSAEMQRLTFRRARLAGVADRVRVLGCGLESLPAFLDALEPDGFDAVVSNFGALNCVPCLDGLGAIAARHLRPGGSLLLCVMGRRCLWEIAYLTATGRRPAARRRRQPVAMVAVAGVDVPTYYHGLDDLDRALGDDVTLAQVRGIGVALPPPYLEPRWRRVPRPLRALAGGVDRLVTTWPVLNRCGDHVLARWVKRRYARA